jgi:hypothetical protein
MHDEVKLLIDSEALSISRARVTSEIIILNCTHLDPRTSQRLYASEIGALGKNDALNGIASRRALQKTQCSILHFFAFSSIRSSKCGEKSIALRCAKTLPVSVWPVSLVFVPAMTALPD